MPSGCCVPGCYSNYRHEEHITVFKFPKNIERRKKWFETIQRGGDFAVTDSTVICINHFDEKFIVRNDTALRPDGTLLIVPRTRVKLTLDAFSTIFQNQSWRLTWTFHFLGHCCQINRKKTSKKLNKERGKESEIKNH